MKKILLTALGVCLLATTATAKMPLSIGAGSTGYGATVMDKGQHFTNYWAGLRAYEASEYTAAYVSYQHVGTNGGIDGDGMKAILVSGSETVPWLYLIADIGVAWDLARTGDGKKIAALTTGGGMAITLTEYISPFIYASAYDSGPRFKYAIHVGLAITDIQAIVTKGK